jgi:arylsulfatase A-like enzyme
MKISLFSILAVLGLCFSTMAERPNIVFILCDDLGIGELGCYGQKKLKTPHIDSIATHGMKFENHYSGSTVCAPSRSSLITGQHTGHTFVRGNNPNGKNAPAHSIGQLQLPEDSITLPKLLQKVGYATGMYGKWGLGGPDNSGSSKNQGFDDFFGYYCQSHAHTYYPKYLWHNSKRISLDGNTYSFDLIWDKGMDFIRKNAHAKKPFFAYLSITVPHATLSAPEALHKKWCKVYPEFNDTVGKYGGRGMGKDRVVHNPIAGFAAMMENLDNHVGSLIAELKKLGVYKNTIIIFTSDNGAHHEGGHKPEFWNSNGDFRGYKRDLYEGGVHVPLLVSWSKRIKPGSQSKLICAFWDWLPTLAEVSGTKIPVNAKIDGISFAPTLVGKTARQKKHRYLYWEFTEGKPRKAVRAGKWKMILTYKNDGETLIKTELFNLDMDIGETKNLAQQHPEKVQELSKMIDAAHTDSPFYLFLR